MSTSPQNESDQVDHEVDRAIVEYFERVDQGKPVELDQFLQEHPTIREPLLAFFEASDVVSDFAGPTLSQLGQVQGSVDTSKLTDTSQPQPLKAAVELEVPSRLGRYRIEQRLGRGAMGHVYLAYDEQLTRRVALKVPVFDHQQDSDMIDRFYREARAAAHLRSPHICPVYDVDREGDVHFIAMAYIEGRSLLNWVQADRLPAPGWVAQVLRKLALALQKAHESGVVHRDLKPSNIMIDQEGEPVVMDFGLARRLDQSDIRHTKAGTLVGSPAYMSPEQILGEHQQVGPQSDVYSLGVIMFELLTGRLPFQGSVISVIGKIVAGEAPRPHEIRPEADPRLADICMKMMAKSRDRRYASMADVAADLARFAQEEHPTAPPQRDQATPPVYQAVHPAANFVEPNYATAQQVESDWRLPGEALKPLPTSIPSERTELGMLLILGVLVASVIGMVAIAGAVYYFRSARAPVASQSVPAPTSAESTPENGTATPEAFVEQPGNESATGSVAGPVAEPLPQPEAVAATPPAAELAAAGAGNAATETAGESGLEAAKRGKFRYQFTAGDRWAYALELKAQQGSIVENLNGHLLYEVRQVDDGEAVIDFDSQLSSSTQTGFPGRMAPRQVGSMMPLKQVVHEFPRHEMTVDRRGRVLQSGCDASLPYGLGNLARLVFVIWPNEKTENWQDEQRTQLVTWNQPLIPRFGPFARQPSSEKIPARLRTSYEVTQQKAGQVDLRGDLKLSSNYAYNATGTTVAEFDRSEGKMRDLSWSIKLSEPAGLVTVNLVLRRLSDAELARQIPVGAGEPIEVAAPPAVEVIDPAPGKAVTADTELKPGDQIQAYRSGRWHDVTVVKLTADGKVRVHWVGFGPELDEDVARKRLRILSR